MTKNSHTLLLTGFCWLGIAGSCFAQPAAGAATGEFSIYHVGNSLTGDLISQFPKIATPYEKAQGKHRSTGACISGRHQPELYLRQPRRPENQFDRGHGTGWPCLEVRR